MDQITEEPQNTTQPFVSVTWGSGTFVQNVGKQAYYVDVSEYGRVAITDTLPFMHVKFSCNPETVQREQTLVRHLAALQLAGFGPQ